MENVSFKDFLLRVQSIDEKRETSSGPLKVRELNEEITQFLSTLIEPKHSILPVLAHIISEQKIYEDLEYAKVYLQDYFINDVEDIEKITSKEIENLLKHITHRNYRDEILHPKTVYSKYYYNHYTAYCALELFYNVWAVISYLRNNPETHDLSIITFNLGMWLEKQAAYKRAYGLCFIQEEIPKWKINEIKRANAERRLVLFLKFVQNKELYFSLNDIASKINNSYLKTLNAYLLENNSIPFKENSSTQNSIYNWLKRQLIKHDCFDGTLTKAQVCNLLKYLVATDTNG